MQPGDIFQSYHFKFNNGETSNKLIILITDPNQSTVYYFVLTTTQNNRGLRRNTPGCYANELGGYYFFQKGTDWFRDDTWILFEVYKKKAEDILIESLSKNNLIDKGTMKKDNFRALIKCMKKSQDIERSVKALLPY